MLPTSRAVLYLAIGLGVGGKVRCNSWMRVSGFDMSSSFAGYGAITMQRAECGMRNETATSFLRHWVFPAKHWPCRKPEERLSVPSLPGGERQGTGEVVEKGARR